MEAFKSFGIQPVLLLAQIVNFLIIVFLLRKFFYGPIVKMLSDRKKTIEESLKNADAIQQKLEETDIKTQKVLEEARQNAQVLIADAKKEARKITDSAIADSRKLTEDAVTQGKAQIEAERIRMQKDLQAETMVIAGEVAKKILGRTLSSREKQEMTKKSVAQITKQIS